MCRMLIALGNFDLNPLLESIIAMARDQTTTHELNQEKGLGSWKHDDGWGIAYLNDKEEWVIHKSIKAIYKDPQVNQLKGVKTNLAIIHTRKKMGSKILIHNTHPFHQNIKSKSFVFCHNGFIDEEINFHKKFNPKGETDSEKLFYSILTDLKKINLTKAIWKNFKRYQKLTGTNIIIANKKKSVVAVRKNNFPRYYQMHLGRKENFLVISSEKLPALPELLWEPIEQGDVVEIKNKKLKVSIHKEKI